jgi:hypothetical protein
VILRESRETLYQVCDEGSGGSIGTGIDSGLSFVEQTATDRTSELGDANAKVAVPAPTATTQAKLRTRSDGRNKVAILVCLQ